MIKELAAKILVFYKNNSSGVWLSGHSILYTNCKFYPTCSEYTAQVIDKYGVLKGLVRGTYRVLRCNPLSKGGVDLP